MRAGDEAQMDRLFVSHAWGLALNPKHHRAEETAREMAQQVEVLASRLSHLIEPQVPHSGRGEWTSAFVL